MTNLFVSIAKVMKIRKNLKFRRTVLFSFFFNKLNYFFTCGIYLNFFPILYFIFVTINFVVPLNQQVGVELLKSWMLNWEERRFNFHQKPDFNSTVYNINCVGEGTVKMELNELPNLITSFKKSSNIFIIKLPGLDHFFHFESFLLL